MKKLTLLALVPVTAIAATVSVSWEPVYWDVNDRVLVDGELYGYTVYAGTESGNYSIVVPLRGEATEYRFDYLQPLTPYFFTVVAVDRQGRESAKAAEVSATTLPEGC